MVALEMFNRTDDYLFEGWSEGLPSPLVTCLNTGWRTGLSGVTDEHGTDWGFPEGKGRSGLWVTENTREAVFDTESGDLVEFTVPLGIEDGDWVVLRISDPTRPNENPGPAGHPCNDWGVAYSSPWWLQP